MLEKARIKLNIKRLYAADALAVKDLLKMATLLYKATHSKTDMDEVCISATCLFLTFMENPIGFIATYIAVAAIVHAVHSMQLQDDLSGTSGAAQLSDARASRTLGSEITQAGVAVFDALQREPELREARHRYKSLISCSTLLLVYSSVLTESELYICCALSYM